MRERGTWNVRRGRNVILKENPFDENELNGEKNEYATEVNGEKRNGEIVRTASSGTTESSEDLSRHNEYF